MTHRTGLDVVRLYAREAWNPLAPSDRKSSNQSSVRKTRFRWLRASRSANCRAYPSKTCARGCGISSEDRLNR